MEDRSEEQKWYSGVRSRSKSPAPGTTGRMTNEKHQAAEKSYAESPELHLVAIPTLTAKQVVSNCQMCGTGRGMRKPNERHQTTAHLRCTHCNLNVCGAGCWQLLHGTYSYAPGEGEVLDAKKPSGKAAPAEKSEDEGEEQVDDEAEDEGEEEA